MDFYEDALKVEECRGRSRRGRPAGIKDFVLLDDVTRKPGSDGDHGSWMGLRVENSEKGTPVSVVGGWSGSVSGGPSR